MRITKSFALLYTTGFGSAGGIRKQCKSPVHESCILGHAPLLDLLIKNGGDVNIIDEETGRTPLDEATLANNLECMQLLLSQDVDVNHEDNKQGTPLHKAVSMGNVQAVELLLKHNAQVNLKRQSDGLVPLMIAIKTIYPAKQLHVSHEIVELLIQYGAEVQFEDHNHSTPLHEAAKKGNFPTLQLLLEKGADVNKRDLHQQTPLLVAAANSLDHELISALIGKGAEVNVADIDGNTPLINVCSLSACF